MKTSVHNEIRQFIKDKATVCIYKTDETGEQVWAVCVKHTDFWLNAFKSKERAIRYCKTVGVLFEVIEHS